MGVVFGVLGELVVRAPDGSQVLISRPILRRTLGALLVRAGQPLESDVLAEHVWGDDVPSQWKNALHSHVSKLRRELSSAGVDDPIETDARNRYCLRVGAGELDAEVFEERLGRGLALADEGRGEEAIAELDAAEQLWRGTAYDELAAQPPFLEAAERLDRLRLEGRTRRMQEALAQGEHRQVLGELAGLARAHRWDEPLQACYLLALYRCGQHSEALRHYEVVLEAVGELGAVPGPDLRLLHEQILRHDPGLDHEGQGAPSTPAASEAPELPASARLALRGWDTVGLDEDLGRLDPTSDEPLVVVRGQPGGGKTRVLAELARRRHDRGAIVLWGAAAPGPALPFQAFLDALRPLVPKAAGGGLRAQLASTDGSAQGRYELFEAVADTLASAAARQELLLVIDDCHWFDDDSLALWLHLVRRRLDGVTLATSIRSADPRAGTPAWLTELLGRHGARVHDVPPFGDAGIRALGRAMGRPLTARQAGVLRDLTGGNPLFLVGLLRSDHPLDGTTELPENVRAAVGAQLDGLAAATRRLLELGALMGAEFPLSPVATALGADGRAEVDEAVEAGIIRSVIAGTPTFAFVNEVGRQAILEALPPDEHVELHHRLGVALEAQETGSDSALASLAVHFLEAARDDAARAARYSMLAGDQASADFAHAEAARHYANAIDALVLSAPDDAAQRCQVLCRLGESRLSAYATAGARTAFAEAAELALATGSEEDLNAALSGLIRTHEFGDPPEGVAAIIDRSAAGEPSPARAALVAAARARILDPAPDEADRLLAEAERLARATGDDDLLGVVLVAAGLVRWRPDTVTWRRQVAEEIIAVGRRTSSDEVTVDGHRLHCVALLEGGDFHGALAEFDQLVAVAAQSGRPAFDAGIAQVEVALHLMNGRFAQAEQRLPAVLAGVEDSPNFAAAYVMQRQVLCRELGRYDEVIAMLGSLATDERFAAALVPLALAELEVGRRDEGLAHLRQAVADGLDRYELDWVWLITMATLAEVAASAGDAGLAAELLERLRPYADQLVVFSYNVLCLGSVHRFVALAAATVGERAEALEHLEAALDTDDRIGAWPAVARDHLAMAQVLALPGAGPDDREVAAHHRSEALELAAELGMPVLEAAARRGLPLSPGSP